MKYSQLEYDELSWYIGQLDFDDYFVDKTILITGAKGLVGTALVKWILLQNELKGCNTQLICSTRHPDEIPEFIDRSDNIEYCEYGSELDLKKHVDYIVHAASPTGNTYHMQHPLETFRTNVDGIEKMLQLAARDGSSLIYLSSEEIYGLPDDSSPAMKENMFGAIDSLNLRSCYPLGKKAAEFLCYASANEYGIDAKIIRPTVIQGLFQRYDEPRVVNEILRCILENKDLVMKSDGLTKKCMMYSLDAVSAIFTVLFKGTKGEAYNASNEDTFMTVRDLTRYLFRRFNSNCKIVFAVESGKKSDGFLPHRTLVQDCTKLKLLGWKAMSSIDHIYEVDIKRFGKC